jgi:hypothetical protein
VQGPSINGTMTMEFVTFKIKLIQKFAFERTFEQILKEGKIACGQWQFQHSDDHTIAEIPKYAIDRMTPEQIELLNEFSIGKI